MYGTAIVEIFAVQLSDGMVHVFTHRKLGPLHSDQIFVSAFSTFHGKPVISFVTLVLFSLHKVPSQDEMFSDVILTREDLILYTRGVRIGKRMLLLVPSSVTQVQSTNKGHSIVDDNKLFVMCPIECHI